MNDIATEKYWNKSWGSVTLPRGMNPWKNPIDFRFQRLIKKYVEKGSSVLEIGCGGSTWMPFFRREMACRVSGIDYSEDGLWLTHKNMDIQQLPCDLHKGDFLTHDFKGETFDVIFSRGVIEHYEDPRPFFERSMELLNPGGLVITVIPNNRGLFGYFQKKLAPEVFKVHMPFSGKDLDEFQKDFAPVMRGSNFGVFYSGVVNFSKGRLLSYALQTLDRVIGWLSLPFGRLVERAFTAPYSVSIYRKPKEEDFNNGGKIG